MTNNQKLALTVFGCLVAGAFLTAVGKQQAAALGLSLTEIGILTFAAGAVGTRLALQ